MPRVIALESLVFGSAVIVSVSFHIQYMNILYSYNEYNIK
ncbi:hypothetical protein TREAZ_2483 [Leadbettera azotonutricia ZAS-9]|uniref:Uncharacterized protein n=1 Tax=Leadbettera azotonutricia (strain ATCC BAA-888 / DSM 13862 / ZAS-9) TaxID=545695 RepID=F5YFN7_LEAAZ|nr:hypothetical protein TREAZ_2483 [Leadbettera azotonutricia ZAS-9]